MVCLSKILLYKNMLVSNWLPLQKGNLVSLTTRSLWRKMLFSRGRNRNYFVECRCIFRGNPCRQTISWGNDCIPLQRFFLGLIFHCAMYQVERNNNLVVTRYFLKNNCLRCPILKIEMYGWNISQPTTHFFERGSTCAEHAIFFSDICLSYYAFTKVQHATHCRKQSSFQDAWFPPKKIKMQRSFQEVHF